MSAIGAMVRRTLDHSPHLGPVNPFRRNPPSFVRSGEAFWHCHGCGFPWMVEREACIFCPDEFIALRGESDAPYAVARREMRRTFRERERALRSTLTIEDEHGVLAQADGAR